MGELLTRIEQERRKVGSLTDAQVLETLERVGYVKAHKERGLWVVTMMGDSRRNHIWVDGTLQDALREAAITVIAGETLEAGFAAE